MNSQQQNEALTEALHNSDIEPLHQYRLERLIGQMTETEKNGLKALMEEHKKNAVSRRKEVNAFNEGVRKANVETLAKMKQVTLDGQKHATKIAESAERQSESDQLEIVKDEMDK